jgi:TIR domain/Sel1 repeat
MNGQIFISYRREDASYPAGRLYDHLQSHFPNNQIFMDVDSLKAGVDFVQTIEEKVGACDVLVAVIGKLWLSAADKEGRRRLDNPEDFVRVEVGTALKRGVRVIPVLVEGALMPPASQLPEDLKPLARRNALSVSHDRFRADSERLIDSVGEVLEAARVEGPPRPPEEPQTPRGRAPRQDQTEPLPGLGAGPGAPASDRTPLKGVTANLKRPRQLLVVIGIGIVVCLLGVSLFKATRPQPVSTGASSSPTPAPLAAALNSPSPTPLVSQVSPSPSPSGAEGLTEAKHYLDLGDYAKALPPLQKAADAGDAVAMNSLGVLYEKGRGVTQDYAQARQWFQKAAEAGNYNAMEHLGYLYQHGGFGVTQDYAQARQWYQKAAEAGNAYAKQALARLPEPPPIWRTRKLKVK